MLNYTGPCICAGPVGKNMMIITKLMTITKNKVFVGVIYIVI